MNDDVHQFIDVCVSFVLVCMKFALIAASSPDPGEPANDFKAATIRATCTAPMNKSIKVSLCFTESHLQGSTEHTVVILMEHNYAIIIIFVPQYENTSATQHNQYLITKKLNLYISTSSSRVLSFLHLSPCCTSDPLCATVCYCCCFTVICINSVMNRI